jgi:hypothetical protein
MSLGLTPKKTAHLRAMEPKERAKRKWGRQWERERETNASLASKCLVCDQTSESL